jgi:hypothetical protein
VAVFLKIVKERRSDFVNAAHVRYQSQKCPGIAANG